MRMSDSELHNDIDLLDAFKTGDADAFAEIYDRHSGTVFGLLLAKSRERPDAIEATHDTFLEAATRLEGTEIPGDLETWLLEIAARNAPAGRGEHVGSSVAPVPPPPALRVRVLTKVDRRLAVPVTETAKPPVTMSLSSEMVGLGIFVVVTLVVGLVGIGVAASFEPLDSQPTAPGTESPGGAAGGTTATTSAPTQSTARSGPSTTAPAQSRRPAAIEVSTDSIALDGEETSAQFELRNTGGQRGQWELASSSGAIVLSARQGELDRGEAVTIEVSVDSEQVEEGELAETLTVSGPGGQTEVAVNGTYEDNPIIHNPQASPASVQVSGGAQCSNNQTTISAQIRDTSPLESVVVRWSPDGDGEQETAMESVGNDMFEGVVGPFTVAEATEVRIVAFDGRGNAGGASAPLEVVDCP